MTLGDCRFLISSNDAGNRNANLHSCGDTPIPPVFPNLMDVKFNASIFHCHNVRLMRAMRKKDFKSQAYCATALGVYNGLPVESLISLAQIFSTSVTTLFGIGT